MKFGKLEGIFYKPFISLTIIAEIKRGRRAYTRKNENTTKATQPENEAEVLPASPISSPDGGSDVEKSTPESSSESQLLPPHVNTKLPAPFVLATGDNEKSTNSPSVLPETNKQRADFFIIRWCPQIDHCKIKIRHFPII